MIDPNLSDIPPPSTVQPSTPRSMTQAGDQEEQPISDIEEQTQTVVKKRHASSALAVSLPIKRIKKTGGQFIGNAIGEVGEQMERATTQREKEFIQREIEETQRIKETSQTAVENAMALLLTTVDPKDSEFVCQAADIFLNEKKAHIYTTLSEGIRNDWLQRQIDEAQR